MATRTNPLIRIGTTLAFAALSFSLLTSCGRIGGGGSKFRRVSANSYPGQGAPALGGVGGTPSDYTCPSTPNVVPDYDSRRDGTGYYIVCPKRDSQSDIEVHGEIPYGSRVCIIPVQSVNDQVFVKPDVANGGILSQCIEPSSLGVYASFPGITWNAAFIVPNTDLAAMKGCLAQGTYFSCPSYSYGRFR